MNRRSRLRFTWILRFGWLQPSLRKQCHYNLSAVTNAVAAELDDPEILRWLTIHRDIIVRFGRFPHRNAMLGRAPRPDEVAAGDVVPW